MLIAMHGEGKLFCMTGAEKHGESGKSVTRLEGICEGKRKSANLPKLIQACNVITTHIMKGIDQHLYDISGVVCLTNTASNESSENNQINIKDGYLRKKSTACWETDVSVTIYDIIAQIKLSTLITMINEENNGLMDLYVMFIKSFGCRSLMIMPNLQE